MFVTALEKGATLATAKSALDLAPSPATRTAASSTSPLDQRVLDNGKGPDRARTSESRGSPLPAAVAAVNVLDHDGRRQDGKTLAVRDGGFDIDTGRDKAIYYEVVFKE